MFMAIVDGSEFLSNCPQNEAQLRAIVEAAVVILAVQLIGQQKTGQQCAGRVERRRIQWRKYVNINLGYKTANRAGKPYRCLKKAYNNGHQCAMSLSDASWNRKLLGY